MHGGPHSGGSDGWAAAVVSRSAEDRRSERRRRRRRWYGQWVEEEGAGSGSALLASMADVRRGAERSGARRQREGGGEWREQGAGLGLSRRASTVPWRACGRARGHAAAACCARSAMTSTSSKSTQELAIPPQKYTETPIFLPS